MKLTHLSDDQLVADFQDLVIEERERLVLQLEYILELDRRKLFFGYPSLWGFLIGELKMDRWDAERKIRIARLLRKFPELIENLESGKLNISLLELALNCASREKLSDDEFLEVIHTISGKSLRDAKRRIASLYPHDSDLPKDKIAPISEDLSLVSFVTGQELLDTLDEIRDLLAHAHPHMSLAELFGWVAGDWIKRNHPLEKAKRAEQREAKKREQEKREHEKKGEEVKKEEPSPAATRVHIQDEFEVQNQECSSHVESSNPTQGVHQDKERRTPPQFMIHALTLKEGYQCSFVDARTDKRCQSKRALEIHHRQSWSSGGKTELSNLIWLCNGHHERISYLEFGESSQYYQKLLK
jgi:hypothetical protein